MTLGCREHRLNSFMHGHVPLRWILFLKRQQRAQSTLPKWPDGIIIVVGHLDQNAGEFGGAVECENEGDFQEKEWMRMAALK